jgi:hypothetical protein
MGTYLSRFSAEFGCVWPGQGFILWVCIPHSTVGCKVHRSINCLFIPVVTWRSTIWLNFIWRLGISAAIVFRASLAGRSISLFFSSSVAYFLLNRLRYFSSFWDLWYSYWYCSSRCWSCSLQLFLEVRILPDCLCFHLIGRCHRQRQYYISECSVIESHK